MGTLELTRETTHFNDHKDGCHSRHIPFWNKTKSSKRLSGKSTETLTVPDKSGPQEKTNVRSKDSADSTRQMSPAVQAVMEMGIPVQYVELANEVHVMETGKEFLQVQDLYLCAMAIAESPEKQHELALKVYEHQNAAKKGTQIQEEIPEKALNCSSERIELFEVKKVPDKTDVQQRFQCLLAENKKLKKRKLCRSCKKVELASSGVTFLPCGHFIVCEECAEKHDNCPACGKTIMGTVRTFLA